MKYPKYKNKKIEFNGLKFDSKKECERYKVLFILEELGQIQDLRLQRPFVLAPKVKFSNEPRAKPAIRYISDFTYIENDKLVVEDVKSAMTRKLPTYRMKKHLMMSQYGIEIKEI